MRFDEAVEPIKRVCAKMHTGNKAVAIVAETSL